MSSHSSLPLIITLITTFSASTAAQIPPVSEIKGDRPRLLIRPTATPNAISRSDLRASSTNTPDAATLLNQLKSQPSAAAQAMVFFLTSDDAAAQRAIRRMRDYRYPGNVDTFHIFFRLTEFALAYDWLYYHPAQTEAVKQEIRANVAPLAAEALRVSNDHLFHNYVWMSASGLALWAMATAGEDEAANELFDQIRSRFNDRLFPAMQFLDGLPSEPMGYWALYVYTPALHTLLAAQSAFDKDLIAEIRDKNGDWLNRNFHTLLHATLPDLRYIPWGDLQSGPNGGVTHDMASAIDMSAWALRSREGLAFSQFLATRRGPARFRADTALFYFLYSQFLKQRITESPQWPSLTHLAGNSTGGHFIARSDWTDSATIVAFRCADHFGDHNHWDQGSFLIYRRGLLAVDPPIYRQTRGPQQKTEYHNTLLIGGQEQRPVRGQSFPTLERFRQNLTAGRKLETGDILFHRHAKTWSAVAGQFAQAYDIPSLKSCVRQLLYIRPGTLIIVDQLEAHADQRLPDILWLLHLPTQPRQEQSALLLTTDHSYLRCRTLLPTSVTPQLQPTPMNTIRAAYTFPSSQRTILVHVLECGDAAAIMPAAEATTAFRDEHLELNLGQNRFDFSTTAPFTVAQIEAAPDAATEPLFLTRPLTAINSFTRGIEGPACDADGNIFAVNLARQQTIGKVTPDGKAELFVTLPGPSTGNGIVFSRDGMMFIADYVGHNVLRVDPKTRQLNVFAHDDRMNQPNDLAIAADGTLYASDPDWKQQTGQLWRIDTNGKTTLLGSNMGTTNGIELSPDGKTLYVNESVQRNVWAFTIADDRSLRDKRLLKRFGDHGFDGMRCDVDGNLYITRHGKGTVVKLSPAGEVLKEIDVLGKSPSNICFGGPDGRTAYITEAEHQRLVQFRVDRPGLAWKRWPRP